MCDMDMGHFANPNLSVAVERCWYSGCVNTKLLCVQHLSDLEDRIYDCLLTATAAVQAVDARA